MHQDAPCGLALWDGCPPERFRKKVILPPYDLGESWRSQKEAVMARSHVELFGLEFEAERLVRSGESRAEVARRLNVHPQTLAGWALRGGWRKKDLDLERSVAITRRVVRKVAASHAWEEEKRAILDGQERLIREAITLLAAGDGAGAGRLLAGMRDRVVHALPGLDERDEYAVEAEQLKGMRLGSLSDEDRAKFEALREEEDE